MKKIIFPLGANPATGGTAYWSSANDRRVHHGLVTGGDFAGKTAILGRIHAALVASGEFDVLWVDGTVDDPAKAAEWAVTRTSKASALPSVVVMDDADAMFRRSNEVLDTWAWLAAAGGVFGVGLVVATSTIGLESFSGRVDLRERVATNQWLALPSQDYTTGVFMQEIMGCTPGQGGGVLRTVDGVVQQVQVREAAPVPA